MRLLLKLAAVTGALLLLALAAMIAASWAPDRTVESLKARWAPPPSQFVRIGDLMVHLRDEGPREDPVPIVLIHGTSASLHTWEGWAQALRERRRVIRFDLPGFGLTGPSPERAYTIEAYARFVGLVLDSLGVARCVLAGNSLGGNVAWAAALAMPARVDRLILVDAAGYPFTPEEVPLGFRLARLPGVNRLMEFTLSRGVVEASVKSVFGDPGKVTAELVDRYYEIALREGNRRAFRDRFEQTDWGAHAARIRELKAPTLILWGGRDRLIPPESARRFRRDIAGSELEIFDDLGHVPQEEDPARTVAAVKSFLGL